MTAGVMAAPLARNPGDAWPARRCRPSRPLAAVLASLLLHLCCLALFGLVRHAPLDGPREEVIVVSLQTLSDGGDNPANEAGGGEALQPSKAPAKTAVAQARPNRAVAAEKPRERAATTARIAAKSRIEPQAAATPSTEAPAGSDTAATASGEASPTEGRSEVLAEAATGSAGAGRGESQAGSSPAAPRLLQGGQPRYPDIARRRGLEGTVLLQVLVLDDGRVGEASVRRSSAHRLLDAAALDAVRDWRFAPASQGGKPVAMAVEVPVAFRLTNG